MGKKRTLVSLISVTPRKGLGPSSRTDVLRTAGFRCSVHVLSLFGLVAFDFLGVGG